MRIKAGAVFFLLTGSVVVSLCASAPGIDAVAKVGAHEISRAMLNDSVNQTLNTQYFHGRLTDERRLALEKEQIQVLIRRRLNIFGARDRDLALPEAAAERTRAAIEGRLGEAAYLSGLEAAGMTAKDHLRALAETMAAEQAYKKFVLDEARVNEEEIRTAFAAAPDHWRMPESQHVLHILLKVRPDAGENEATRVRAEADSLLETIAGGEDFGAVAARHSHDMYRVKGGDLGWVRRGSLIEPLEKAVWGAEIGILVGPVRSAEGFHMAKILGRRPARAMEYAEVEPMLRQQLEGQKLEAAETAWFGDLRKKYPVVILDPELKEGS